MYATQNITQLEIQLNDGRLKSKCEELHNDNTMNLLITTALSLTVFLSGSLYSQNDATNKDKQKTIKTDTTTSALSSTNEEEHIYTIVEDMPQFPGGKEALKAYFKENLVIPDAARDAKKQGTVYVTFVVDKSGKATDAKILSGIGYGCNEEAIRAVLAMPNWRPGKQKGRLVKVQYNLPVKFQSN